MTRIIRVTVDDELEERLNRVMALIQLEAPDATVEAVALECLRGWVNGFLTAWDNVIQPNLPRRGTLSLRREEVSLPQDLGQSRHPSGHDRG